MKRKLLIILSVVICIFIFNTNHVLASSGALKKDSIKTCPNGITYGQHSDHWHVAEKKEKGYYPKGDPIYSDPCNLNNQSSNNNSSNNNQSTNTSKDNNTTSNKNQTTTSTSNNKKKSNDTSISKLTINNKVFNSVNDIIEYTASKTKIDIQVETKDQNAKYEIQGNVDELSKDKINEIKILVTAEDGTTKTYIINIKLEIKESNVRITSLNVNGNSIYFGIDKTEEITLSNSEEKLNIEYKLSSANANLFITSNGKEIQNGDNIAVGKNTYLLTIKDENGHEYSYELIIERMTKTDDIISSILGLVTLSGIGYVIYYFLVKKKKEKR